MAGHGQCGRQAILLDLGGVLIDWNPRYLYRSLARPLHLNDPAFHFD
jgi:hypothetical protein